jgi:hypothetical protein
MYPYGPPIKNGVVWARLNAQYGPESRAQERKISRSGYPAGRGFGATRQHIVSDGSRSPCVYAITSPSR